MTPMLTSLFDVVYVTPLTEPQVAEIAGTYAATRAIGIDAQGIRELMALCTRFLPSDSGPGRLVRLIQQIADYQREKIARQRVRADRSGVHRESLLHLLGPAAVCRVAHDDDACEGNSRVVS